MPLQPTFTASKKPAISNRAIRIAANPRAGWWCAVPNGQTMRSSLGRLDASMQSLTGACAIRPLTPLQASSAAELGKLSKPPNPDHNSPQPSVGILPILALSGGFTGVSAPLCLANSRSFRKHRKPKYIAYDLKIGNSSPTIPRQVLPNLPPFPQGFRCSPACCASAPPSAAVRVNLVPRFSLTSS